MPTIRQHIPSFIGSGPDAQQADYRTVSELLAIPFVARWATDSNFHRFSQSQLWKDGQVILLAEQDGGKKWWVIGYLSEPINAANMPLWQGAPS